MDSSTSASLTTLVTSITGLIGVITGFASIWFTYLNYSKDNVQIKVKALKGMRTFSRETGSSKESYLVITAANAGRRTVIINKAGFVNLKSRGGAISSSSMIMGAQELNEGKAIDYMMDEEGIDYSDVSHVVVYDSVGNEYRYHLATWYTRFFYWFLDITYLRHKPIEAHKSPAKQK